MSKVTSARSPGASSRAVGLPKYSLASKSRAADAFAEPICERHAQQWVGLQLRSRVEDARAQAQRAVRARIARNAPLAKLIG